MRVVDYKTTSGSFTDWVVAVSRMTGRDGTGRLSGSGGTSLVPGTNVMHGLEEDPSVYRCNSIRFPEFFHDEHAHFEFVQPEALCYGVGRFVKK